MTIIVLPNQSLLDVAIQYTGSVENAFNIAFVNGYSVSDYIATGSALIIPDDIKPDKDVLSFYKRNQIAPATDMNVDVIEIKPLEGIGYWEIENNFEIQ